MKKTLQLLFIALAFTAMNVMAQSTPYQGEPAQIPGVVYASFFDEGGQDVAYWDLTAQQTGNTEFRNEEMVDMEKASIGGWNVGWTNPGEWVKYIVDIDSTASYELEFWYASGMAETDTNKAIIEFASGPTTDTIFPYTTGDWQAWEVIYDTLDLTKGIDTMKITMATGGFNFHHFDFTRLNGDARVDSFTLGDSTYWGSWITEREIVIFESSTPTINEVYLSDAAASFEISDADAVPGTATIKSKSPDGTDSLLYTINLRMASSDGTASEILVNSEPLPGFDSAVDTYDMELPEDKIPRLSAKATDPNARGVVATRPSELPGAGTIVITAEDWSEKTYTINFTVVPDKIETSSANSLKLYPNPASNSATLDLGQYKGSAETLTVYDMYGHIVQEVNVRGIDQYLLDTSEMPNAVYFVTLTTSGDVFTSNLIIAR